MELLILPDKLSFQAGYIDLVRMKGLEPPRPEAQDPKSCAATNYATSASGMNFEPAKVLKISFPR